MQEVEPIPPWKSEFKHWGKEIPTTVSVKEDKEHLLAFDLSKALLLPSDVTESDHVPDTQLMKSAVKSMTKAIQKQHLVMDHIVNLHHKVTKLNNAGKNVSAELGRAKAFLEIANADNARLLGQLNRAEQEKNALKAELEAKKQTR